MSNKDYEAAVNIINCIPDPATREVQAALWASYFKADNPAFCTAKFLGRIK